jgi:hypothetical protein
MIILPHRRKAFQDYRVGLAAEWDADSISGADLSEVDLWPELVSGANGTQTTPGRKPNLQLAELNGHNVVDFNGNHGINTTYSEALGDFTIFVVYKATSVSVSNYDRILDKAYDTGFWIGRSFGAGKWGASVQNTTPIDYMSAPVTGPTTGVWYILSVRRNGIALTVRYNGTLYTASTSVSGSILSTTTLEIGNEASYTNGLRGMIAAIRVYSASLTDDARLFVERRFGSKYGISIV